MSFCFLGPGAAEEGDSADVRAWTDAENAVTRRLIKRFANAARPTDGVPDRLAGLTPRELDVLRLVAQGRSNTEIAAELVVEESTVKTHVRRILLKLDLRDRVQAVVLAYECGFSTPDPNTGA